MDLTNVVNSTPQELDALIKKVTEVYSWIARDNHRKAVSDLVPLISENNLRDLLAVRGYSRYPCTECGDFFISDGDATVCSICCENPSCKESRVSSEDYKDAFYKVFRSETSRASEEMWEALVDFIMAADAENAIKAAIMDCAISMGKP